MTTNLLIGSRALNYWFPERKISPNTDWDVISSELIQGCEFHPIDYLNNSDVINYRSCHKVMLPEGQSAYVVNPKGLALIKRSHLWRSLGFQKHITDYHKWLEFDRPSCQEDYDFLNKRIELSYKEFGNNYPKLNVSKDEFFDDYVTKKYDHDYLHELVAFYSKPMYTKLQLPGSEVWCDKSLWDQLSHEDKLKTVAEETMVICIERFLVPTNWNFNSRLGYFKSLEKVCTTLCSGWFRSFAIDYYPEVVGLYNKNKFEEVKFILFDYERKQYDDELKVRTQEAF